jgi:3-methyladenine DNA glycosylase AlkD
MTAAEAVRRLQAHANPANVAGMARYGINPAGTLGVSMAVLRRLARATGSNHSMAQQLWETGIHEARILATLVAEPARFTSRQADRWARDLDSWDVCDQFCQNLLRYTPYAFRKAAQWSRRRAEFTRRAAFSLMAGLATAARSASDRDFEPFFPLIAAGAADERNMVKKAVNWALRQIGKRSPALHARALETALEIQRKDSRAARWIAADALRELRSDAVVRRLALHLKTS